MLRQEPLIPTTGNEYPQHQRGKIRLNEIVKEKAFIITNYEVSLGTTETSLGERYFIADILGFWYDIRRGTFKKVDFEVDGNYHNSRTQLYKMVLRDNALLRKGIQTVRILVGDLVGKKKLDSETIWKEILYQLD